jgi:hypothetical protein
MGEEELRVDDGEEMFHALVYWPGWEEEPFHMDVAAPGVEDADARVRQVLARDFAFRGDPTRVELYTLEEWLLRESGT